MLVGLFLWQNILIGGVTMRRKLFLRIFLLSLPLGFGTAVLYNQVDHAWALTSLGMGAFPSPITRILFPLVYLVASLGMDLAYLSGIALLLMRSIWMKVLNIFVAVGRMPFTNYVLQALIPALLFGQYTPGFQKEAMGNVLCIVVLITVFGFQVLFSQAWLRHFRFGPFEWLWRSLTYWRLQPMQNR
jgi:uncharacterized protein